MILGGNWVLAAAAICAVGCPPVGAQAAAASTAPSSCMIVIRALSRGAVAGTRDVAPMPCPAAPVALSLRYDPTIRAMRAARDLSVGETLPAIPAFALPVIRPGDRLRLVAQVGAVTVERQVTALQAGQAGDPLFVRAADGAVFTATFREIAP